MPEPPAAEPLASNEGARQAEGVARLRRVVVGFNERPASRDALALAQVLCAHAEAELIVASVRPYWSDLLGAAGYAKAATEDEAWLRREAAKALGPRRFTTHVIAGGPSAGGLKEIAASEHADLIVVGSTHRGPVGRVLPGSVGEQVLEGSPCAVGIAPVGLSEEGLALRTIAVAYDGSRESKAALELAIALAERAGASVLILSVAELEPDVTGLAPDSFEEAEVKRVRGRIANARRAVPPAVAVSTQLLRGPADRALLDSLDGVDLLVLGSRGHYGPARRLFLGSVARRLVCVVPCASLITPAL